jgi:hypothetical protein
MMNRRMQCMNGFKAQLETFNSDELGNLGISESNELKGRKIT